MRVDISLIISEGLHDGREASACTTET